MYSQSRAQPSSTSASASTPTSSSAVDPSRGQGNAAMQELLRSQRSLEVDGAGTGSPTETGTAPPSKRSGAAADAAEHHLEGDGDLLFASATTADLNAKDQNSYTTAIVVTQREHPDWTLAQVIRHVNSLNVNGLGSELAMTGEAATELGGGVGFRAALVIGNHDYQNFPDLEGAARDAGSMASMYGTRGYEVDHQEDLSGAELTSELRGAGQGLGEGDEMLLYYAGHGLKQGLVGVDTPRDGRTGIVPNTELVAAANRLKAAGVKTEVVLDACQSGAAVDDVVARDGIEVGRKQLGEAIQSQTPGLGTTDLQGSTGNVG